MVYAHVTVKYIKSNNRDEEVRLTEKDYELIDKEYHTTIPIILKVAYFNERHSNMRYKYLRKPRRVIFSLYLICGFYVL